MRWGYKQSWESHHGHHQICYVEILQEEDFEIMRHVIWELIINLV